MDSFRDPEFLSEIAQHLPVQSVTGDVQIRGDIGGDPAVCGQEDIQALLRDVESAKKYCIDPIAAHTPFRGVGHRRPSCKVHSIRNDTNLRIWVAPFELERKILTYRD